MKQIYYPYWDWEDFQNGMYTYENKEEAVTLIGIAKDLLSSPVDFGEGAREMIFNWPKATAHNLTNRSINRKAWIGHATCCFIHDVPEVLTRIAWSELTQEQRDKANQIAEEVIRDYEAQNN